MTGCVLCPVFRPVDKPRLPRFMPCCDSCRTRLRVELAEIPDLYALIPDHLEPETGTGVKVSGTRTPPLPLRLDPLNLLVAGPKRQPVHDLFHDQYGPQPPLVVLDLWVAEWIDTRGQGERQPVPTITTLTGWLLNRLDWALDNHPAVDEFARETHQTLKAIRSVTQSHRTGASVGTCPSMLRDDTRCDAKLYADPYVDSIACGRCGSTWTRRDSGWLHLAAMQAWWVDNQTEEAA